MDRYRIALLTVLLCCLTALTYVGKIRADVFLGFVGGLVVPAYDTLRRRGTAGPALPVPAAAPPSPRERTITAPQWVLPTLDADDLVERTAASPPPLPDTVAELGATIRVAAEHPDPDTRRLNADRAAQAVRILQKAGGAVLLVLLPGCASHARFSPACSAALGWAGALLSYVALRSLLTTPFAARRPLGAKALVAGLAAAAIAALMGCSPAQRAAAGAALDRYGAAVAACELRGVSEVPMELQSAVSGALHLPPDADWRGHLEGVATDFGLRLGAKAARCLLDAEVLRYTLGGSGPQVRSQALALRQPGELGAGAAPQPDLARQRATEWTTGAR